MLKVKNLHFGYSSKKLVLENFNLSLKKGEHLCVMGESGCGKSTLLKAIYGLVDLKEGSVLWGNQEVLGPASELVPGFKKFKYVAQDFDLMPFISVKENIKKFLSRFYPEESEARALELLEVIEMTAFANQKVKNLSGGQKQRVAIARALAKEPELLLLDEPFSQIDNFKKNSLRRKLFTYLKENNITAIVATHDKNDALSFADKLLIIKDYKILVNDYPKKIYNNPKEKYVAALFDDVNEIIIDGKQYILYPHQLKITENHTFIAKVKQSYFKGSYWLIACTFQGKTLFIKHKKAIENNTDIGFKMKNHPNSE